MMLELEDSVVAAALAQSRVDMPRSLAVWFDRERAVAYLSGALDTTDLDTLRRHLLEWIVNYDGGQERTPAEDWTGQGPPPVTYLLWLDKPHWNELRPVVSPV